MHPLLPGFGEPRVYQQLGKITAKSLDTVDQLLLILPKRVPVTLWKSLPEGLRLRTAMQRRKGEAVPALQSRLQNKRQTLVVAGTIAPDASAFEQLTLARKLIACMRGEKAANLGIAVVGFDAEIQGALCRNAVAAAFAAAFPMPRFKSEPAPERIRSIRALGLQDKLDFDRVRAESLGNNIARWLTSLPPNKLDAVEYAELLHVIARDRGWGFKRHTTDDLRKLGAGAFLAVAQGNDDDSASIVRIRYRPGKKAAPPDLSLVGKGIIFDTGGTNLKPFQAMIDMHGDMQGSAVALGALLAISQLELPIAVDCWLAITENRSGPRAYKSQDLVTAANGKTIQTIHTDAEGRMALADTLVLACREEPRLIIDYATLTGACINAITTRMSGIFTNRPQWHPRLKRTGTRCGERVWPFPIGKEFLSDLESSVADIRQCSIEGRGDHILAASFLAEFIKNDIPWLHIDLSASNTKGGLAQIPTEITGFGVRYTLSLLLDEMLLPARPEG